MLKHLRLKQCDSTHLELKRHVDVYQIVSTENQTAGRGRGENSWQHQEGALAFSFSCSPHPQLTWQALEVSVSIAESIEEMFKVSLEVKWPNDLFRDGKKCGGILLQHQSPHMLIGVGLNLWPNSDWGSVLTSRSPLMENWAHEIPHQLVSQYMLKHPRPVQQIREAWIKRCTHFEKSVIISEGEVKISGRFDGIGEHGEAIIDGKSVYNGMLRLA